ncbi:maleylacetate reductase [Roseobacter sp. YSTF-M11]|uniref:Maleylacetate reductase n=1 Tax=Roseobacter insulae TaxID=2859783 RepID=A0A9X1JXH7_9RHOB|nr:maleylacetate reductase [Roseobacter insulae]MBW4707250.1 maleylacetate reductase [Roseobacter insulae]
MSAALHDINQTDGVRVRFGAGLRREIGAEVDRLGARRALVLSTPQQCDLALEVSKLLGGRATGVYTKAAMHTPVAVTEDALEHLKLAGADCLIAIGGGSTIGLGKALAYRTDLAQIAVPTTYAGSEATPILGQTEKGEKTTLSSSRVLPEVILYDPELVATLPVGMTVTSGLNALAHAAEALYAENRTPETTRLALDGIHALIDGLPRVMDAPGNLDARAVTQQGAWACGTVLGRVGMALHHKLCHTLGGSFDLPHAETHAIILPHAIAYNARAARRELGPLTAALGGETPGMALYDFARSLGAPLALRDLGIQKTDLDRAAALATQKPYPNPQPVTREDVRALLQAAWAGNAPAF